MDFARDLESLLAAGVPIINLVTYEEERVLGTLEKIEAGRSLGIVLWDVADGFEVKRQGKESFPVKDVTSDTLLRHLSERMPNGQVVVLRDFHQVWNGPKRALVTRKLRNMAPSLRSRAGYLIITSPIREVPVELRDEVVVLEVPLPEVRDLETLFDEVTRNLEGSALPGKEISDRMIRSALGLTTAQARLAFQMVWAAHRKFDERAIARVTLAKQEVIRESGALEFWPESEGVSDVGGLDLLKKWLATRERGFTAEARAARLPYPRGAALIGIPGTGKSLTAKMLSGLWKLPLLRLDVGALFGSLLGESEQNMRRAISLAETVSPCILWVDELEKAFAGSSAGSLHAGAATRVFGTFLTWMQEHKSPVFVMATANDVSALAPELMSRFDRVFFLDLPSDVERHEIFKIHLTRAGETFPERRFDFGELVEKSRGFVGREIERVVREAQFAAFAEGEREIEQEDLHTALEEVVPISRSHAEAIDELRKWKTDGRAFPASSEEAADNGRQGRIIETWDN